MRERGREWGERMRERTREIKKWRGEKEGQCATEREGDTEKQSRERQ